MNKKPRVAVDSGHGTTDPGAIGGGMQEKKINWNVTRKLIELLNISGYDVLDVRRGDECPGLTERAKRVNAFKADIFVSVHHNAGGGDGYEIIYQIDKKFTDESKALAFHVGEEFDRINNKRRIFYRRGTKNPNDDYYTVIALANSPSIITEFAFLDSADVKEVDTLTEQWEEAYAIFNGIQAYFGRD